VPTSPTNNQKPGSLRGPIKFIDAIVRATKLNAALKSLCVSLYHLSDWNSGENIMATIKTIGEGAGLAERTVRQHLRTLESLGIVVSIGSTRGGIARAGHGLVPRRAVVLEKLLKMNPANSAGLDRGPAQRTPADSAAFPVVKGGALPGRERHDPRQKPPPKGAAIAANQHLHQNHYNNSGDVASPTRFGPVVAGLSKKLREHKNATPDRCQWLEREAPKKRNPSAFAATAIREAFAVPPPSAKVVQAAKRKRVEERFEEYQRLPERQKHEVLHKVWRAFPNLKGEPFTSGGVRGAIAQVMERERSEIAIQSPAEVGEITGQNQRKKSNEKNGPRLA
jgi:hypothetical protein